MFSPLRCSPEVVAFFANLSLVWIEEQVQVAKQKQAGVQAELDRRRAAEAEAEARRQEIKNSLR